MLLEFEPIIPVNYPEGDVRKPWCPHTKIIEIGGWLAGLKLTPDNFCGEKMTDARYSEGAFHYLKSANYFPRVSCKEVQIDLMDQMELVERDIKEPDIKDFEGRLELAMMPVEKATIAERYAKAMHKFQNREDIIKRWKETIFDISYSHKGDEPNPHFRQFEKAEDVPLEETISKVKDFIEALKKITGYRPLIIDVHGGAKNCPQSPRMRIDR